jgi:hypothetical protein
MVQMVEHLLCKLQTLSSHPPKIVPSGPHLPYPRPSSVCSNFSLIACTPLSYSLCCLLQGWERRRDREIDVAFHFASAIFLSC